MFLLSFFRALSAKNGLIPHLASFDLPMTINQRLHQIITDGVRGHDPGKIGWFWPVYAKWKAFSYFPIGVKRAGHEIDLTLGHQDKNSKTYMLWVLMTSSNPVSFILILCEL